MQGSSFMLPRGLKPLGSIFTVAGSILGVARFYFGFKPDLLNFKIFAIYSSYLQSKHLEVIRNQMVEEVAGLLIITGLFMLAFAREKNESEQINTFRLKAFFITVYLNTFFLIIAILFTFGLGFVYMMIINLFLVLILYIISFRVIVYMSHNKQ